jgi:MinD-like ATPase involved in chromosome partitioning or flagellar assembly
VSVVAIAGDNTTTTTLALAAAWPVSDDVLVIEADPRGGSLASWLDIPVTPSLSTVVTRATHGEWPVIERLSRLTPSGLRVIPAPVRAVEASRAVAESSESVFPTLESLTSPVVLADTGPLVGPGAVATVVAQSTLTLVVHRQAQQSARAAAVRLERLAENFERLMASAVETALVVIGRAPFDADEIASFVGTGAVVPPRVVELADDPLAAAVLAGRSGVSRRRLLRLPLLRSSEALAAFVSNRLTELAAIDRWKVGP